jgi:DNA-binding transcriptional LysR family regulator
MSVPAITIHDHAQARAAFAAAQEMGCPLLLLSPPGAAGYLGVSWLAALVSQLRAEYPGVDAATILDCAADAGYVMAAVRQKAADKLIFTGSRESARRLREIAAAAGIEIMREAPPSLDLDTAPGFEVACRDWLRKDEKAPRPGD